MTPVPAAVLDHLAQPELADLWRRVRDRLERNGINLATSVRLDGLDAAQRHAVGVLVGRPYDALGPVTVRLTDLDARLKDSAAACGLVAVLEELGPPLRDRQAERGAARRETAELWGSAHARILDSGIADGPAWLEDLRRTGVLARVDAETARSQLAQAVRVLQAVDASPGSAPTGRTELAARVTGTAHGLDDGTLLARLVLRALAARHGLDRVPADAQGRRALWRAAGVATDEVSSTVLVLGLRPRGEDVAARVLRERADASYETHLTGRDLARMHGPLVPPGHLVSVCENPRVLEAAADRAVPATLVCTSGNPATVVRTLLDRLVADGARLRYHGDFDWPGVAMAHRLLDRHHAAPWRLGAADYEAGISIARAHAIPLEPLTGEPVPTPWDPELIAAMTRFGVKVEEETILEALVSDLSATA